LLNTAVIPTKGRAVKKTNAKSKKKVTKKPSPAKTKKPAARKSKITAAAKTKKTPVKSKPTQVETHASLFMNPTPANTGHSIGHRKMNHKESFKKDISKNHPQNQSALNNMSASNVIKRTSFVRTSNK
jgi:hypothetical protein